MLHNMHGLDTFFHGVSHDLFNNPVPFIDFPPEDLEPSSDFGDSGFQAHVSSPVFVPSGFHTDDAPELKPTIIPKPHDHSVSATKSPHFLNIISEESIQDGKLEIPADFVIKHFSNADEISNRIVLEVPSSEKWEVQLIKSNGKIWLQNGWKEFMEHHSLKCGCSVVFRYDGNCKFHVLVFDKACVEIEYSKPSTGGNDLSINMSSEPSSYCFQQQERSSSPFTRPFKMRKSDSIQNTQINSNSGRKGGKGNAGMKRRQTTDEKKQTLSNREKANAIQIAASFKSNKPYFLAVVQPSFLSRTYRMTIPAYFSHAYLKTRSGKVTLSLDGKLWQAKWYSTDKYSDLRCGWKLFANDNNLGVGDVCVFEMIDDVNMLWNVVIHRRAKGATATSSLGTNDPSTSVGKNVVIHRRAKGATATSSLGTNDPSTSVVIALSADGFRSKPQARKESLTFIERARALERTKSFKSDKPFFVIVMPPAYVAKTLCIPLAFAKKHFKANGRVILKVADGRDWRVSYSKRNARFGDSWKAFVRDNNIQVGDACVFELIGRKEMILNVVIFRTSDANQRSSTSDCTAEAC